MLEYEEALRLIKKYDYDYGEILDTVSSRRGGERTETVTTVVLQIKIAQLEERIEKLEEK
jgi:hypothetical protein